MADEKRRLIYELLVEAKGLADGSRKAKGELTDLTQTVGLAKRALGTMFAGFTVAAAVRGLIEVNDEITSITQQLKVFSIEGAAATQAIHAMQDTAVATGASLQSVANAYKDLSDVAEVLGLSQADVADLVDASTRAMMAQGGTAEQAAGQISTLTFAVEKGTITSRELRGVLKENEVLQQAFEQALGKTTAEILKQAEAGQIGAAELKKVLAVYTELGQQQTVAPTMATITNSLKESAKAFAATFTEASGLSQLLKSMGETVLPQNADAARSWAQRFGEAINAMLPEVVRVRLEVERLVEAQKKAQLEGIARQQAETAARFAPAPITAAERRIEGSIPMIEEEGAETAAERDARRERQAQDARVRASRLQSSLENTFLVARRETAEQQLEIVASLDNEREIVVDIIAQQQVLAGIEQDRAAGLEETLKKIEEAGPPKVITESLLESAEAAQVLAHSLTAIFSGAVHNARDFFRTILQGLAEIAAQKAILEAIGSASTKNAVGTGLLGLLGFQRGAAFDRGRIVPMAAGEIVSGPTLFPLAGGRTGLMGEAGAEAVMPLRRGRDGRLGVSGAAPSVVINNQTGIAIAQPNVLSTGERLEITLRSAQLGADMAVAEVNRSIRQGYGATANSLARSYGLRRRV